MLTKTAILGAACAAVLFASPVSARNVYLKDLSPKQVDTLAFAAEAFAENQVLIKVAFCESSLEHTEKDGSVKRGDVDSRDTGLMQINKRWHDAKAKELGLNLERKEDNAKYAIWLFKREGLTPWKSSRPCWKNLTLPEVKLAENVETRRNTTNSSYPK